MLVKFSDKNEYGYNTWRIMFNKAFQILIIELNPNEYSIELKEANWIKYKKVFDYKTSSSNGFNGFEAVVYDSIERVHEYFQQYRNDFFLSYQDKEAIKQDLSIELAIHRTNN